jgi:hypothetical protein
MGHNISAMTLVDGIDLFHSALVDKKVVRVAIEKGSLLGLFGL